MCFVKILLMPRSQRPHNKVVRLSEASDFPLFQLDISIHQMNKSILGDLFNTTIKFG
jgi:hypothetical protein